MSEERNEQNPKDRIGSRKVDLSVLLPIAEAHEALALMDGERKYTARNWREKKVSARIYLAAALRHIQSWAEMEENAPDSGVHHLGHARACLGILLDAQETGNLIDDRKPGKFPEVLERLNGQVAAKTEPKSSLKATWESGPVYNGYEPGWYKAQFPTPPPPWFSDPAPIRHEMPGQVIPCDDPVAEAKKTQPVFSSTELKAIAPSQKHKTGTQRERGVAPEFSDRYWAVCSCGWKSHAWITRESAELSARFHVKEAGLRRAA